jgi:hypothetical protein
MQFREHARFRRPARAAKDPRDGAGLDEAVLNENPVIIGIADIANAERGGLTVN